MFACDAFHANASAADLEDCYSGVSMDMTSGCRECLDVTDWNATHCMLHLEDLLCTPCDLNIMRTSVECCKFIVQVIYGCL